MKDVANLPASEPSRAAKIWGRVAPTASRTHATAWFWLSTVGLGCLSLGIVCWIASAVLAKKTPEKVLRISSILPKLNSIHGPWNASRKSEPVPSAVAHPKERTLASILLPHADHPKVAKIDSHAHAPTPEPPHSNDPWLMMLPKLDATPYVECNDPVVYLTRCAQQPGDTPMIRNWKMLTLASLLSAATVWNAPPIVFAQEPKSDALEKLQKAVEALDRKVDALQKYAADKDTIATAIRIEMLKVRESLLMDLKDDISAIRSAQARQEKAMAEHKTLVDLLTAKINALPTKLEGGTDAAFQEEMRRSIKNLEEAVAKLNTKERISLSPPINGNSKPALARVKLVNEYPSELLFTINGVGHRLPARTATVLENVPTGAMNYEVFMTGYGILDRQVTTVSGGQTFTVTAR